MGTLTNTHLVYITTDRLTLKDIHTPHYSYIHLISTIKIHIHWLALIHPFKLYFQSLNY